MCVHISLQVQIEELEDEAEPVVNVDDIEQPANAQLEMAAGEQTNSLDDVGRSCV